MAPGPPPASGRPKVAEVPRSTRQAERLAKEKDRKKGHYEEDEPPKAKAKGGKGKKGRADYSDPGSDSDEGARPPPKKPKPGASSSKPFKPSKHGGGGSSSSKHGLAKPKSSGLKKSKH